MILRRMVHSATGIFGQLLSDEGKRVCFTLEHSYVDSNKLWGPKIPNGTYACVRGAHILSDQIDPFETFEITEVPGHTGILFHAGNLNLDSSGCVLLGQDIYNDALQRSRLAFALDFMNELDGIDSFQLTVS